MTFGPQFLRNSGKSSSVPAALLFLKLLMAVVISSVVKSRAYSNLGSVLFLALEISDLNTLL